MIEKNFKREIAYKIKLSDLASGVFVRNEGSESNHVLLNDSKISRVNIVGIIIDKTLNEKTISFNIDDGFETMIVTFFDNLDFYNTSFIVGETVIVIGRVNDYNGIKINGEIIKKTDKLWLEVRKKELLSQIPITISKQKEVVKEKHVESNLLIKEDEIDFTNNNSKNETETDVKSPHQKVWESIKGLDEGTGVDFDGIKEILHLSDEQIDVILQSLIREGEIYEIKPGYYKVLE